MARDEFEARELAARSLGFLAEKREPKDKPKHKDTVIATSHLIKGDPSRGISDSRWPSANDPCVQRGRC